MIEFCMGFWACCTDSFGKRCHKRDSINNVERTLFHAIRDLEILFSQTMHFELHKAYVY